MKITCGPLFAFTLIPSSDNDSLLFLYSLNQTSGYLPARPDLHIVIGRCFSSFIVNYFDGGGGGGLLGRIFSLFRGRGGGQIAGK